MKKSIISLLLIASIFVFAACRGTDKNGSTDENNTTGAKDKTDSTRGTPEANSTPADQTKGSGNEATDFVTKAASGGLLEVKLGELAEKNAQNQRVKNFGKMMVTDHSKANDELKSLASSNKVAVPSALLPDHQKHYDMLKDKKGADFDKAYMDMMVDDHKEDISEFKKEANSGNDPFKGFASKTLPVLEKHLDSAQAIHSKL